MLAAAAGAAARGAAAGGPTTVADARGGVCEPRHPSASASYAANIQPPAHSRMASQPPAPAPVGVQHASTASPLVLRIDRAAFFIASLAQLSMWLSLLRSSKTAAQKTQPVATLLLTFVGIAVTMCLPRAYCRNRTWALPLLRLLVLLVPSARSTNVGSALVLERQPLPGLRGLLGDLGRLTLGTRVILLAVQGVSQLLPPSVALLTQTAATLLTWNPRQYCSTQLLRAPLTAERLAGAAAALEYFTLPVVGALIPVIRGQLVWGGSDFTSGEVPPDVVCQAFVGWFHAAVAVVMPTLVSAWCWHPPALAGSAEPEGGRQAGSSGRVQRLSRSASKATAKADCMLHSVLATRRWAVCWFLLSVTWLKSKALVGRP